MSKLDLDKIMQRAEKIALSVANSMFPQKTKKWEKCYRQRKYREYFLMTTPTGKEGGR